MSMQIYYTSYQNGHQRYYGGHRPGHPVPQHYQRNVAGRTAPRCAVVGGSYSSSLAQLATAQCRSTPPRILSSNHQSCHPRARRNSSSTPPQSLSHQIARQLEMQEKLNNGGAAGLGQGGASSSSSHRDSHHHHHHLPEKLHDLVEAIRHPLSHSTQCTRISTSSLHIGECPEVPEHTATFAMKRTGTLKWQEAVDEEEEETVVEGGEESPRTPPAEEKKKLLHFRKNSSAPNLLRKHKNSLSPSQALASEIQRNVSNSLQPSSSPSSGGCEKAVTSSCSVSSQTPTDTGSTSSPSLTLSPPPSYPSSVSSLSSTESDESVSPRANSASDKVVSSVGGIEEGTYGLENSSSAGTLASSTTTGSGAVDAHDLYQGGGEGRARRERNERVFHQQEGGRGGGS
ncbi:hypothetical protein CSUI_009763 [Cystoisospora suis]|uniref:Uncharacterized protein n=1 Tax=Cystoisospora suis TaxID=483139 RepID=A0A2C6KJ38_9APIC|nr:hypothetical protein CSUI_009763 [Cystoisospora suis]